MKRKTKMADLKDTTTEEFEKELQKLIQKIADTYVEGMEAIEDDKFLEYVAGEVGDFVIKWAKDHPDDILNKVFTKEVVESSRIPASSITKTYKLASNIKKNIQSALDIKSIIDGANAYQSALEDADRSAQHKAIEGMMSGFFGVTSRAVELVPLSGPVLSLVVDGLENVFETGLKYVTARIAQLEYVDAMCEYYTGSISAQQLYARVKDLCNLTPEKEAEILALIAMEKKWEGNADADSDIPGRDAHLSSRKDYWTSEGQKIYNEMSAQEKEEYDKKKPNHSWTDTTTEESKNDAGDAAGEAEGAQPPRDPLIIDLGKKGIELTDVDGGVYFNLDKNGFAEKTAWIGREDGFLFLDRNGNGMVDDTRITSMER